jgi:DNA repair protein RecO (recombination protein O)
MALKETEAVVLQTHKLGEADKIAVLLTRNSGVIRGAARGARRLKSRFGASLEPFTHVRLTYFEKETRELVSLREAEIVRSYFELSSDDAVYGQLEYLSGLVTEFSPPHEPNERLFRMAVACLECLAADPSQIKGVARYFEVWTLKLSGFWPALQNCKECDRALAAAGGFVYIGPASQALCAACARGGLPLGTHALAQLRAAHREPPQVWARGFKGLPPQAQGEIAQFTGRLIEYVLERAPRRPAPQGQAGEAHAR